jgi:predicted alpha/beta hydrolase family esterase
MTSSDARPVRSSPITVLVQPGYASSGEDHWQTHWERAYGYHRIEQDDWLMPDRADWVRTIEAEVEACSTPVVFAAHSLGCIAIAQWAAVSKLTTKVRGALFVAPADVDSDNHTPEEVRSFAPIPERPLPFRTTVIASQDDPFMDFARSRQLAALWGARFIDFGPLGHINSDSRLALWPEGHQELLALLDDAG